MKRKLGGTLAALSLAACAPGSPDRLPARPLPHGDAIAIVAEPAGPSAGTILKGDSGRWAFAGGLKLTSQGTSRLHGLSDLKVWPDGRMLAVGDQGDLLEARLAQDAAGWVVGVTDATLKPVLGEDGRPITLRGAREYDAEGVAEFANGDQLISFEQHDRVLFYPRRASSPPRLAPKPDTPIAFNKGLEALAAYPAAGADAYLAGVEGSGEVFLCRVMRGCAPHAKVDLEGLELTALHPLPLGRTAYLLRTYNPLSGNRIILKVIDRQGAEIDRLVLARPFLVDNFEGLAAVPRRDGVRFFLISDDNFNASQQTLLFALDWTPPQ